MNKAYKLARKQIGTREIPGSKHNSKIVGWFKAVGHAWVKDDETAWCAAFVGAMLKEAGMPHTGKLNARSYLEWGEEVPLDQAKEGDLVVFWRGKKNGWQGHVGFFVRAEGNSIVVLGGNQANAVNEKKYAVSRLLGVRRMKVEEPVVEPKPKRTSKSPSLIETLLRILRGLSK